MRFRMLGPLEVAEEGRTIPLGGRKQRALLAVMLLQANEVVSRDRLIDALWGETPPPSAAASLDAYVHRLRKLLGHDRIPRGSGGYSLRVEPDELDVRSFERLLESADDATAAGDHAVAAQLLGQALALWRGPALADLVYEPFVDGQLRQLEERRVWAVERRIDAELAVGRDAELVAELEQLTREHPLRERLHAARMLALYRAGRQADALAAFRTARRRLIDELGLEPGPELRELERRILKHDPALAPPRRARGARGARRSRARPVAAVVALGAVAATALIVALSADRSRAKPERGVNRLVALDPRTGQVLTATRLPGTPEAVASGAGSVWVADPGAGTVSRIDPRSGAEVDRIAVSGEPGSIVSGAGAIWVASTVGASVARIDPTTESVTQTIALPGSNLDALAIGKGGLWIADSVARRLFEIDPESGQLRLTLSLDLRPSAIALADGGLWVAGYDGAIVEKLDPLSGRVAGRVRVGSGPVALAFGFGSLWVANSLDATVSRIDPVAMRVRATIAARSDPSALAAGAGAVWVGNRYFGRVLRIDPLRNRVVAEPSTGSSATSLALTTGRLWVGAVGSAATHRGGTLVIVTPTILASPGQVSGASVDPAFYNAAGNPQFIGLAYDSLVTFQKSGGAAGLRLVPDLAVALPAPTDGGATYAFRLRPGIRYSDGRPLRAGDFRRAIERLFRVGSPGADFFAGVVGAQACEQRPAGCDLAHGVVTDDTTRTVVFHLTAPDPNFLFKLTESAFSAPIPPGTPDHEADGRRPPGTGPYTIAGLDEQHVRFVRNPFFREWSHAAQPAGNPDVILWRRVSSPASAVQAVEQGRGDWIFGLIPRAQYRRLQLTAPAQLHTSPQFDIEFAPVNTHRAPFNDIRVRRALNYAVDRAKIAQMYGGPGFATPACQPLAPGLPGYRRYCPYTKDPRADGAWTAPDLARAQRLVTASGTRGERVDVWGVTDSAYVPSGVPAYFAQVLRSLGYRVQLHLAPYASITWPMRRRFQLSTEGDWVAEYPDASSYLPQFFGCRGGTSNGYYCDPRIDREMRATAVLEQNDPAQAAALWTRIDHQLTDDPGWVPTVNGREVELVSKHVHNYEYNPIWGFIADQAWLR